jgi:endonuclease/exonuclease/phosphatase family metal-dependent hydrolase
MRTNRLKKTTRVLSVVVALGVLATPALVASSTSAATSDPKYRKVSAPNVFYPVKGSKSVKDLKKYSSKNRGTTISAPCHTPVYATHPGTAEVGSYAGWHSKFAVRVVSGRKGLATKTAYLTKAAVVDGQILQAGQVIGYVGRKSGNTACGVFVSIYNNSKAQNPTSFLNSYVGKKAPITKLFDNSGFNVASFNILGASHTTNSSRYGSYTSRMPRAVTLMNQRKLDVVGTQEFQGKQYDYFLNKGHGKDWGACFWDPAGSKRDTENLVLYRRSTMELVECKTFDIPYFYGNIRHVPAALLKEKATGRTFYFLNVHNAANVRGNAAKYRAQAIAIEKQKIIDLRATGRPVFLAGDFNDRQAAFCPLTANKLSISPNSIPSMTCAYPRQSSIDWIFAAGQVRFSSFLRDMYPKNAKISDHPLVQARAHIQP